MKNSIEKLIDLVAGDENLQRQEYSMLVCQEAKVELNRLLRIESEFNILKLKARKVVMKKDDADRLGHVSAFARAVNELKALVFGENNDNPS
mgnify:CR=1 FL=1